MAARAGRAPFDSDASSILPRDGIKRARKICFHCRNRKVRCDGTDGGCENCARLGFQCSFSDQDIRQGESTDIASPQGQDVVSPSHGHIPLETRRTRRACNKCHVQKARCSGENPSCQRCRQRGYDCVYSPSKRQVNAIAKSDSSTNVTKSPSRPHLDRHESMHRGVSFEASPSTLEQDGTIKPTSPWTEAILRKGLLLPGRSLEPQKLIIDKHIEAYFTFVYPIPGWSFIHRSIFLQNWRNGTYNPILLQAMCGATARFLSTDTDHIAQAKVWTEQAESEILKSLAQPSVTIIQALLLVIFANASSRKFANVIALAAIAARMAFTLRLNLEEKSLSFTFRECRNRVMWAIFAIDTFYASGQRELSICPAEHIHLNLPCHERCFAYDIEDESEPLRTYSPVTVSSNLGLQAYAVKILDIRHRIQCFARSIVDSGNMAPESRSQLQAIESELEAFMKALPATYAFNPKNLCLRANGPQCTTYIMIHIWWHMCHCDLFRFTIPRFREGLPRSILDELPLEFITYCQERCWEHAISFTNILSAIVKFGGELFVSDSGLAICCLQIARIISHLGQTSPRTLSSIEINRQISVCSDVLERQAEIYSSAALMRKNIIELMQNLEQPTRGSSPQRFEHTPNETLGTAPRQVSTKDSIFETIQQLNKRAADATEFAIEDEAPPQPQSHPPAQIPSVSQNVRIEMDDMGGIFGDMDAYVPYDMSWMIPSDLGGHLGMYPDDTMTSGFDMGGDPFLRIQNDLDMGGYGRN